MKAGPESKCAPECGSLDIGDIEAWAPREVIWEVPLLYRLLGPETNLTLQRSPPG